MFALVSVLICIFAGSAGQIAMKAGMERVGEIHSAGQLLNPGTLWQILSNVHVITGLSVYALASILWLGAMSTLNISFMYPLMSLAYVVTAVLAFFVLGESIVLLRWMGIVLVVVGCSMILHS